MSLPNGHSGPPVLDEKTRASILALQKEESTQKLVYERLAHSADEPRNNQVLARIAREEENHYHFWRSYTREEVKPNVLEVWFYLTVAKLLGLMFGLRLMELRERRGKQDTGDVLRFVPEARAVFEESEKHEQELIKLVDDERLRYLGSVVLGLNDALVELTGVLAGLTFALQNARLVAVAGLITGLAAALSMAASEYLSIKSDGGNQDPVKASIYTGTAYVLTVLLLIAPYVFISNLYLCLGIALLIAVTIIAGFSFYVAVAKELRFTRRFFEMTLLALGVSMVTFAIGALVRMWLPLES